MTIVVAFVALLACVAYLTYTNLHAPSDELFKPRTGGGSVKPTESDQAEAAIEAWQLAAMVAEEAAPAPAKVKKAPKKIEGAKPRKRGPKKTQARRKR